MQVSANIIHFPAQHVASTSSPAVPMEQPADIVAFSAPKNEHRFDSSAHEHGQVHAAHRIVSRVADQLDGIASL